MDIGTGLALFGTAKIVERILGPTAEYLGGSVEAWSRKRIENMRRIFGHAERKLGTGIEQPGQVSPRVLRILLDDGSFTDDALAAEYFGGVLASSRTGVPRDDRGAAQAGLLGRLSAYQIRTHYLVYSSLVSLFQGTKRQPQVRTGNLVQYIPYSEYVSAMAYDDHEGAKKGALMTHAFYGLAAHDLIGEWYAGDREHLSKVVQGSCAIHEFPFGEEGIVVEPSVFGLQLFCWAHGKGDMLPDDVFNPGVAFPDMAGITQLSSAHRLSHIQSDVD